MSSMESQTVSVRLKGDKLQRVEQLAGATDRPKSWHLEQALDAYLDVQAWQIMEIENSLEEAAAREGVPHDKVQAWADSLGKDNELDLPQ